jgi:hypothetical protein
MFIYLSKFLVMKFEKKIIISIKHQLTRFLEFFKKY